MRKFVVSLAVLAVLASSAFAWERGENRGDHSEHTYDGSEIGERSQGHNGIASLDIEKQVIQDYRASKLSSNDTYTVEDKIKAFNSWADTNGFDVSVSGVKGAVVLNHNGESTSLTERYKDNSEQLSKDLEKAKTNLIEHGISKYGFTDTKNKCTFPFVQCLFTNS